MLLNGKKMLMVAVLNFKVFGVITYCNKLLYSKIFIENICNFCSFKNLLCKLIIFPLIVEISLFVSKNQKV